MTAPEILHISAVPQPTGVLSRRPMSTLDPSWAPSDRHRRQSGQRIMCELCGSQEALIHTLKVAGASRSCSAGRIVMLLWRAQWRFANLTSDLRAARGA